MMQLKRVLPTTGSPASLFRTVFSNLTNSLNRQCCDAALPSQKLFQNMYTKPTTKSYSRTCIQTKYHWNRFSSFSYIRIKFYLSMSKMLLVLQIQYQVVHGISSLLQMLINNSRPFSQFNIRNYFTVVLFYSNGNQGFSQARFGAEYGMAYSWNISLLTD